MPKLTTRVLVHVGLLVALEIVLSRFLSISTPIMKIGFGFVPIAVCAMLYGPVWAGVAGALADFVGAVLFPIGAYFPGFTLSAALTGVIFGIFLYRRGFKWWRLVIGVLLNILLISFLLNTYWLSILGGTPYLVLLPTRALQALIMIPIQIMMLGLLQKPVMLYASKMHPTA